MPNRLLIAAARSFGPIRRLHDEVASLRTRVAAHQQPSPFLYYQTVFDAHAVLLRHQVHDLRADPRYLTNFLGVRIDPKFSPMLAGTAGRSRAFRCPPTGTPTLPSGRRRCERSSWPATASP